MGAISFESSAVLAIIIYDTLYRENIGVNERSKVYPFVFATLSHILTQIHLLFNYKCIAPVINAILEFSVGTGKKILYRA